LQPPALVAALSRWDVAGFRLNSMSYTRNERHGTWAHQLGLFWLRALVRRNPTWQLASALASWADIN